MYVSRGFCGTVHIAPKTVSFFVSSQALMTTQDGKGKLIEEYFEAEDVFNALRTKSRMHRTTS